MQTEWAMVAKTAVMVDVGRRLREVRERIGMPKEQVALALRMSAGNWAHYETGRNQLAATQLPILADLYGMTLAELVGELLEPVGSCQTESVSDNGSHDKISANYIYTESVRAGVHPSRTRSTPPRELVGAVR